MGRGGFGAGLPPLAGLFVCMCFLILCMCRKYLLFGCCIFDEGHVRNAKLLTLAHFVYAILFIFKKTNLHD
jgi:hypothetical protein